MFLQHPSVLSLFVVSVIGGVLPVSTATTQEFSDTTLDSTSVPARLFQSIADSMNDIDDLPPLPKPLTLYYAEGWLEASQDVAHMHGLIRSSYEPGMTPLENGASQFHHFRALELGMILVGTDLMDGSFDDAAGFEICAKAFDDLAADVLLISPDYVRAALNLMAAAHDMGAMAQVVNGQAAGPQYASNAMDSFTDFYQRMSDVSDSLIDPVAFDTALPSGGQGGVSGSQNCPPTHPFEACTTYRTKEFLYVECGDWHVPADEFHNPFDGLQDYISYTRICTWVTLERTRTYCVCYATESDRYWGKNPGGTTYHDSGPVYDIEDTEQHTHVENHFDGGASVDSEPPNLPEPTLDVD